MYLWLLLEHIPVYLWLLLELILKVCTCDFFLKWFLVYLWLLLELTVFLVYLWLLLELTVLQCTCDSFLNIFLLYLWLLLELIPVYLRLLLEPLACSLELLICCYSVKERLSSIHLHTVSLFCLCYDRTRLAVYTWMCRGCRAPPWSPCPAWPSPPSGRSPSLFRPQVTVWFLYSAL